MFTLLSLPNLVAQENKRYSIEMHTLRLAVNEGLDVNSNYALRPSLFNGIMFGIQNGGSLKYKLGLRRLPSAQSSGVAFSGEDTQITGGEITLGIEYLKQSSRRFYLSYEGNLIYEFAKHVGIWYTDTTQLEPVAINNKKKFIGVGAKLNFNIEITEHISFVLSPRVKFGQNRIQKNEGSVNYWIEGNYTKLYFEPINNAGLTFYF